MKSWTDTLELFRKALIKAQEQREKKTKWVSDPLAGTDEPEWVLFERQTMFDLTNKERTENGFEPIEIQQIIKAENCACGHIDYTHKYALYCARMSRNAEGNMG